MAEEAKRVTGIVKWFSGQKGFGFIAPDDGGEDLFVHQTEIRAEGFRTLREGQRVEFVMDSSEDGRSKAAEVVNLPVSNRGGRGRGGRGGGRRGYDGHFGDGGGGGYGRGRRRGGRYGGGDGGSGGAECYNCGQIGHLARDCYGVGDGGGRNVGYGGDGGGNRGYGGRRGGGRGRGRGDGGGGARVCYNCGEEGHFARDCVNEQK